MAEHPGNSAPDAPSPPPPARSPVPLTSPPDPSFSAPPPPEHPAPSGSVTPPSTDPASSDPASSETASSETASSETASSDVQSATVPADAAHPAGAVDAEVAGAGVADAGADEAGAGEAGAGEATPMEVPSVRWSGSAAVPPPTPKRSRWRRFRPDSTIPGTPGRRAPAPPPVLPPPAAVGESGTDDWDVTPAVDPWAESDESWYAQQYPATLYDVGNLPPTAVNRPAGMPPTAYDHRAGLPPTAYDQGAGQPPISYDPRAGYPPTPYDQRAEYRPAGSDGRQPGSGNRADPATGGVPREAAHPPSGYASVPVPVQQQAGAGQQRPAPPPALLRPPKPSRQARRAAARGQKAAMKRASAARPTPPAPPVQRPLPPSPRRKRRWFRRFLAFCLLMTLCCCGVPAWYGWTWAKQYPVSASVPAGIGDLSLRTDGDSQAAAADLAAEAQRRGNVDATGFGGIYTDGRGRRVIVYGATSLRWSPDSDLRAELGRLGGDYGFDKTDPYDSGESGLFVRCADGRNDDVRVAVCGWADHGSLGTVLFSRRNADDGASDVTTIRSALLSRGFSVPGL